MLQRINEVATWEWFRRQLEAIYAPPAKRRSTWLEHRRALDVLSSVAMSPASVTLADLVEVRRQLVAAGQASATVNKILRHIRTQLGIAEALGLIERNPFSGRVSLWLPETPPSMRQDKHLTIDEVRSVLAQADKECAEASGIVARFRAGRLRALAYAALHTGLRGGELLWLRRSDVDHISRTVAVRPQSEHQLKTSASSRIVGIPAAAADVLFEWDLYLTECGRYSFVFPCEGADRPWINGTSGAKPVDRLKALAVRAGVSRVKCTLLAARHTVATHLEGHWDATAGQIERQLGHSNPLTQRHYKHADVSAAQRVAGMIDYGRNGFNGK